MTKNKKPALIFSVLLALVAVGAIVFALVWEPQPAPAKSAPEDRSTLSFILSEHSEEEKERFYDYVSSMAKSVEYLDVTNCYSNPLVLKVKAGAGFKIRNQGSDDRTVIFTFDNAPVTVPANNTATIDAAPSAVNGLFGYKCDLSGEARAGFLLTIE